MSELKARWLIKNIPAELNQVGNYPIAIIKCSNCRGYYRVFERVEKCELNRCPWCGAEMKWEDK